MRPRAGRLLAVGVAAGLVALTACGQPGTGSAVPEPGSTPGAAATATPPAPPSSATAGPVATSPSSAAPASGTPSLPRWPTPTPTSAPTRTSAPQTTAPRTTAPRPTTSQPKPPASATRSQPAATCSIPAALRGKDLTTIPTTAKVIALTFDGGGNNDGTRKILDTLSAKGAPATFFLTGAYATAYPASAREITGRYPVGNHTQNHLNLTLQSDAVVREQIRSGAASIRSVTGVDPRPYFRFPEGAVNARVIGLVNDECYVPFRWTTDTLGWKGTEGGMSAPKVTSRVLDGAKPGGIVLMHLGANPDDHTTFDADALPAVIDGLRARGYTLVTLERVLPAAP